MAKRKHKNPSRKKRTSRTVDLPVDVDRIQSCVAEEVLAPHQDLGKRLAVKVLSMLRWAYRGAPEAYDQAAAEKDYSEAERKFQTTYKNDSMSSLLEKLTREQAHVFWYLRGQRNSTPEEEKNDYFSAKRLIGFFLADLLLENCRNERKCVVLQLREEYVEYLRSLTIHEYVQHKAFFRYKEEIECHTRRFPFSHAKDYLDEMQSLDSALICCGKSTWQTMAAFWLAVFQQKLREYANPQYLRTIKLAKQNSLARLCRHTPAQNEYIDDFVDHFYDKMIAQLRQEESLNTAVFLTILENIYKRTDIVTIFEYLLRCPLLCHIDIDKHNSLRHKAGKPLWRLNNDASVTEDTNTAPFS